MNVSAKIFLGLAVTCTAAFSAGQTAAFGTGQAGASGPGKQPEIQVVDGKVSLSAEAVPLGRLLTLFDTATGLTSNVAPELANFTISAQFSDLTFDEAVRKLFQGQPLNYMVISGKGIRVTDRAVAVPTSPAVASSSPFPESQPIVSNPIVQPIQQPLDGRNAPATPVQVNPNGNPAINVFPSPNNPNAQPVIVNTPLGQVPNPNQPQQPAGNAIPGTVVPGTVPPPPGAVAPVYNSPVPVGGAPQQLPGTPQQPQTGPGNLGATPGVVR